MALKTIPIAPTSVGTLSVGFLLAKATQYRRLAQQAPCPERTAALEKQARDYDMDAARLFASTCPDFQ